MTRRRESVHKAAKASARNRASEAAQRLERAARRAAQFTPGHHVTCECPSCEAARGR